MVRSFEAQYQRDVQVYFEEASPVVRGRFCFSLQQSIQRQGEVRGFIRCRIAACRLDKKDRFWLCTEKMYHAGTIAIMILLAGGSLSSNKPNQTKAARGINSDGFCCMPSFCI